MRAGSRPGPEIWIRGPVAAEAGGPVAAGTHGPAHGAHGSSRGAVTPRRYAWVGTHGGAGVSTLATVYGGHDCGRAWPGPADPRSVLLVARTHAAGLRAALLAVDVFRRGQAPPGLDLDAVVLVADAPGRLPRPLAQLVRVLESVIDVYLVPWVPAWRLGDLGGEPPRETAPLIRLTGTAGRPARDR